MIAMVVPCFNEEQRFNIDYWRKIVEGVGQNVTFLFVNDGSQDATANLLSALESSSSVKVLSIRKNLGKANAIRQGYLEFENYENTYDFFGFIDSDSAFDADEVLSTLSTVALVCKDFDALFLSRVKMAGTSITRSRKRHIISRIIYTYIASGWSWAPYDTQCGFKIFKFTPMLKEAFLNSFKTRWFFDIELMVRIASKQENPIKIRELPLLHWTEKEGGSLGLQNWLLISREICIARNLVKSVCKSLP